ncbi:corticotropin-releasing factor receptor 2-like [Asterias rubens]|uniref:corticotropin-releasing factor receptor 2-like n=1 Tax=Asterias rubens TaxID=7604 RepID=UPI001454FAB5|nr:corticotropin-releasing factor receptor 2-like [Asterias rubens]
MAVSPLTLDEDVAASRPTIATTEYTELDTFIGTEETYTEIATAWEEEDAPTTTPKDYGFIFNFFNMDFEEMFCEMSHRDRETRLRETGVPVCNTSYDGILCWPAQAAGHNESIPCPAFNSTYVRAYRACEETGNWASWTNYKDCLKTYTPPVFENPPLSHQTMQYVWMFGCVLSLIFLTITLFIFCYFKSLQCTRISIHKNLAVSFILKYICMIVILQPFIGNNSYSEFIDTDAQFEGTIIPFMELKEEQTSNHAVAFCRLLKVLLEYFTMANIFWMFVEGLFLTSRIAVAVFSNESNFKLYLFIGWGSPLFFTNVWALLMVLFNDNELDPCWVRYHQLPYIWLIRVPMIAAILVNSFFLINIVRILVTKLRASNTVETAQMRKSVKAVAVLFPLLGMTYLIYIWDIPSEGGVSQQMYHATNAVLQSGQGVFVAVIYCFMNAEVRMAIRRRIDKSRYKFGTSSRRRTHTNGSCVMATSSEVVLAVTFRKNVGGSTSIDQLSQEMKPFTENVER